MIGVDGFLARAAAAVVLAGALAGCGTVGGDQSSEAATGQPSAATRLIMGMTNPPPLTPPVDDEIRRACPPVDFLPGTASFRTYDAPGSADPFAVRHQANLTDTARECSRLGVEAAIRVGVTGRVIVGPKGSSGVVRLPLRIAVVDETDKPVYSQARVVDVTIPSGETRADFFHLEENIVVPIPDNRFRGWRILVGYDSGAAQPAAAARTSRRR